MICCPVIPHEIYFVLGQGQDKEHALALAKKYHNPDYVGAAYERTHAFWDRLLGAVQISTPEPAADLILNRWMLYQTLSCRIWARTGFYQSGGAFGFRDQLQDALALLPVDPAVTRSQILSAAAHQFEEGDVLHWWHPPLGRGVRTRFSDDLLWLPYVTALYLESTGDGEHSAGSCSVPVCPGPLPKAKTSVTANSPLPPNLSRCWSTASAQSARVPPSAATACRSSEPETGMTV
ncbi:MAG: hypothetical protein AB9907_06115 [Flexilinea sp.]